MVPAPLPGALCLLPTHIHTRALGCGSCQHHLWSAASRPAVGHFLLHLRCYVYAPGQQRSCPGAVPRWRTPGPVGPPCPLECAGACAPLVTFQPHTRSRAPMHALPRGPPQYIAPRPNSNCSGAPLARRGPLPPRSPAQTSSRGERLAPPRRHLSLGPCRIAQTGSLPPIRTPSPAAAPLRSLVRGPGAPRAARAFAAAWRPVSYSAYSSLCRSPHVPILEQLASARRCWRAPQAGALRLPALAYTSPIPHSPLAQNPCQER